MPYADAAQSPPSRKQLAGKEKHTSAAIKLLLPRQSQSNILRIRTASVSKSEPVRRSGLRRQEKRILWIMCGASGKWLRFWIASR